MISGSIVALVTPMAASGAVDWSALAALIDWHIEQGSNAIVAVGTTGESSTLEVNEHVAVIDATVKQVAGRIPVIAGTGANSTREAIELTDGARKLGADACLLVTPYYNKPTQEGLYLHYRAVAEAVSIPQILYNVPGRTACDLHNDTAVRLAEIDNIVAIKDATGDVARGKELIALCGARMAVYSGDDATAVELMLAGGKGSISVTANVAPAMLSRLSTLAMQGEADAARELNRTLMPLHDAMFVEANPIPVKWALHQMGKIDAAIRLPLTPLAEEFRSELMASLQAQGLL